MNSAPLQSGSLGPVLPLEWLNVLEGWTIFSFQGVHRKKKGQAIHISRDSSLPTIGTVHLLIVEKKLSSFSQIHHLRQMSESFFFLLVISKKARCIIGEERKHPQCNLRHMGSVPRERNGGTVRRGKEKAKNQQHGNTQIHHLRQVSL